MNKGKRGIGIRVIEVLLYSDHPVHAQVSSGPLLSFDTFYSIQ